MATSQTIPAAAAVEEAEQQSQPAFLEQIVDNTIAADEQRFEYAQRFAAAAAASKYFGDVNDLSQGAMKIMAGYELGLAPFVSLTGINIIKGRVSLSGELVASMLRKHGFTWKFGKHDDTGCELFCYQNGRPILNQDGSHATVVFSRAHADRAELTKKQGDKGEKPSMYDKYGPDMYYNRCIVRFQRRFAPEVTHGVSVFTPDEIEEIVTNTAPVTPALPQRKAVESAEVAQ